MVYDCQAVDNQAIKFCILPTRHVCSIHRKYPTQTRQLTQTDPGVICGVLIKGAVTILQIIRVVTASDEYVYTHRYICIHICILTK